MNLMETICVLLIIVLMGAVDVPLYARYWEKQQELQASQMQLVQVRSGKTELNGGADYDIGN